MGKDDRDLERILSLYEIIKRYELLVEYLLDGPKITIDSENLDYNKIIEEAEKKLILIALDISDGNKTEAARILKIPTKTLYNKMNVYFPEKIK